MELALAKAEQERVDALAEQEAELEKQKLLELTKAEQERRVLAFQASPRIRPSRLGFNQKGPPALLLESLIGTAGFEPATP